MIRFSGEIIFENQTLGFTHGHLGLSLRGDEVLPADKIGLLHRTLCPNERLNGAKRRFFNEKNSLLQSLFYCPAETTIFRSPSSEPGICRTVTRTSGVCWFYGGLWGLNWSDCTPWIFHHSRGGSK